jgi:hypothetical protein
LKNLKGRDHLRDTGVDGRIIHMKVDLNEKGCEDVDWIHLI